MVARAPDKPTDTWDSEGGRAQSAGDVETLPALRLRIAEAEATRDGWRQAGNTEKYLEACSRVDALELMLDRRLKAQQRTAP